jgi:hypothetical protein
MPYADSDYERSWKMQTKGVTLYPAKPLAKLRSGVVIERRTAGCMCVAISAYDSSQMGATDFHNLTEGTPRYGVSWTKGLQGRCRCDKQVTYDEFLLVTDEAEGRSE